MALKISMAAARVNARLSQDDVCSVMRIGKQTLVNWEHGRTEPSISQMKKLCKLYNIDLNAIRLKSEEDGET